MDKLTHLFQEIKTTEKSEIQQFIASRNHQNQQGIKLDLELLTIIKQEFDNNLQLLNKQQLSQYQDKGARIEAAIDQLLNT